MMSASRSRRFFSDVNKDALSPLEKLFACFPLQRGTERGPVYRAQVLSQPLPLCSRSREGRLKDPSSLSSFILHTVVFETISFPGVLFPAEASLIWTCIIHIAAIIPNALLLFFASPFLQNRILFNAWSKYIFY